VAILISPIQSIRIYHGKKSSKRVM